MKSPAGEWIQAFESDGPEAPPGLPRGQRLYRKLLEAIRSGQLPPGTRLPSARTLAAELKMARGTIDEVLARLQDDGLLLRRVGDGSYVESPLPQRDRSADRPPQQRQPNPAAQQVLQHAAHALRCLTLLHFTRP